jgi:hypothetical protein
MVRRIVLCLCILLSLRVAAQDSVRPTLRDSLRPTPKTLREITVKRQLPAIEKKLDKTIIHVDQQITAAGTTVLELLKKLPGVQVTPDGQINLNGKGGVNVLIDGKLSYLSADDLAAFLAATPSSTIQTIEIMTNPSAKYDAAGTAGIINIVRKKSGGDGLNGSLTASAGETSYPRYNGSVILNYKTKTLNLYLNAGYAASNSLFGRSVTSDIFSNGRLLTEQVSDNRDIHSVRATNTTAGIDLYLSKRTTLTVSGTLSARIDSDRTTSMMAIADGAKVLTGNESFSSLNKDRPLNYTAGWQLTQRLDTSGQDLSLAADFSDFQYRPGQFNSTWNYDASGAFVSNSNIFLDQSRSLHIFGARADWIRPLPSKAKIEAGLKTSRVRTINNSTFYDQSGGQDIPDPTQSVYTLNTENIDAAYLNAAREFKKWQIQSGLRAEHTIMTGDQLYTTSTVRQDYFHLFPTLFLQYSPSKNINLEFRFGRRIDRADYHNSSPSAAPSPPHSIFRATPTSAPP